jgi:hypothetical protein
MPNLKHKRQALLRSFEQCSQFVRGSITSVCVRCSRARCICKNQRGRQAYRLTYKDGRQKTRIVYVPRDRLPRIRQMLANYTRSRRVIEALIETNIALFKEEGRR